MVRSAERDRVVDALGDWSGGSGPLYRLLARSITGAVERGELRRGQRLPSERALAGAVDVSRGVVVAAFDELVTDGVAERRPGSGTFIAGSPDTGLPPGREGSALFGRLVEAPSATVIDLSISVLHETRWIPDVHVGRDDLGGAAADNPWGLPALRERVAADLTASGFTTSVDEVLITTGAQQGISIAAGCWVRPGDLVVVDDPTYPGVLSALAAAGAVVRPVPVDRNGVELAALEEALAARPALVYLQSGPHSPTGGRLSDHRRQVIARWLADRRIPLVEDVALDSLDWSDAPRPAPLAAHIPEHPVAVVGSFSKQFWAGLRVGFVRAPAPVASRLVRVKATHDLGSSTVSQAMALSLLEHRGHAPALQRRNAELARRASLLVELLAASLPDWRCAAPTGGLSLWVRLPAPVAARFADAALRHGISVAAAEGLSIRPEAHRDRIRLTFAVPEAELRAGIARLAAAWSELTA
ncbi:PLP-dependent aminotransferase family protein [Aquihabitans daechungensis]|uniref:aminotransferase-like domain-containing protein n=1 Tax=Aquihabitans daechungensis TaxID=1052257 RepID=UPI003BA20261